MGLKPETVAEINRQAQRIRDEQARKTAKEELAEIKFEERKLNIRKNLSALNAQIEADGQLRQSLSTILLEHRNHKYFHNVTGLYSISGVPIAASSGQTAVFTPDGIIVIERHTEARWSSGAGHYSEEYFVPLKLKDAYVEDLFPNLGATTGSDGSSQILQSILQSPNKNNKK